MHQQASKNSCFVSTCTEYADGRKSGNLMLPAQVHLHCAIHLTQHHASSITLPSHWWLATFDVKHNFASRRKDIRYWCCIMLHAAHSYSNGGNVVHNFTMIDSPACSSQKSPAGCNMPVQEKHRRSAGPFLPSRVATRHMTHIASSLKTGGWHLCYSMLHTL